MEGGVGVVTISGTGAGAIVVRVQLIGRHHAIAAIVLAVTLLNGTGIGLRIRLVAVLVAGREGIAVLINLRRAQSTVAVVVLVVALLGRTRIGLGIVGVTIAGFGGIAGLGAAGLRGHRGNPVPVSIRILVEGVGIGDHIVRIVHIAVTVVVQTIADLRRIRIYVGVGVVAIGARAEGVTICILPGATTLRIQTHGAKGGSQAQAHQECCISHGVPSDLTGIYVSRQWTSVH